MPRFRLKRFCPHIRASVVRAILHTIGQLINIAKILRTLLQKIEYMVDNVTSESLLLDWERGYCVQYRETDPTFIELLAAEDG
ncbi:type VI secretion system Vgr family protein [Rodentibacter pneumotropicus]|uniref:Type VI secretion system Vgr family protein n=1 Tax=Rodentibacter pneumotropicus TaxID=758 RepID=A0A448MJ99_9PAST|nr:type VI secretion system Vgr family protein [Rodentibacter pneumotropicus]